MFKLIIIFFIITSLQSCSEKYVFSHIDGVVFDAMTKKPIRGVTINNVSSDSEGIFNIQAETKTSIILPASGVYRTMKRIVLKHPQYKNRITTLSSLSINPYLKTSLGMTKEIDISIQNKNKINNINLLLECSTQVWNEISSCQEKYISKKSTLENKKETLRFMPRSKNISHQAYLSNDGIVLDNIYDDELLYVSFDEENKVTKISISK